MHEYPKDPTRYCIETTGARRRRVPRWSLEQRLLEVVQQEVSCALDKRQQARTFPMHARMERELLQRHLIKGVQTPVIKGDRLWWKAKTPKRVGVGGAVKQKGVEAPNIEIEVEDCEEYTASFSFYVVSGINLSQVHMVVENLGATGDIPDEGGCGRLMKTGGDTSGEGVRTMLWVQVQTVSWGQAETP